MKHIECEKNQVIRIDDNIRITVLEVHDNEITVSIQSPGDSRIETLRVVSEGAHEPQLELVGV